MNVLILTASTGGGHNRAASALKQFIGEYDPQTKVDVIDAIEECSATLNAMVVKGYKALVTLTPGLFGAMYKSSDKKSALSDTVNLVYQQCAKKIEPIIDEYAPDVIISCHPFAGGILGYMKEQQGCTIPLISIVTDFLPHRTYISGGIDAYITASAKAKEILVDEYEIAPDKVFDYGHPVFDKFYENHGRSREEVLDELGFSRDKRTVLVMAGSFGVSDILEIYENLLEIEQDYQIIVITGKNKELYDAFEELISSQDDIVTRDEPELTRLFYFINNVDDYMHAADLIITKPGGLTTSESIACALPMVVFKAYPGQEEQNAALLVENDIGVILENSADTAKTVGELIADSNRLTKMRESCRKYVRKNSCKNIYELAKKLAETK